jgi:hypothetical protein
MQVTFYLTQASANTAAGPFNISGTTSGGELNTVLIQDGVTKQQLLDGYPKEVANNITGGTVTSTGATCNTTDTWDINELFVTPTPTPTPTETTTVTSFAYDIEPSGESTVSASCSIFSSVLPEVVYAASQFPNAVVQFFTDPGLTIGFGGSGDFHAYKRDFEESSAIKTARVSVGGFTSEISNCSI